MDWSHTVVSEIVMSPPRGTKNLTLPKKHNCSNLCDKMWMWLWQIRWEILSRQMFGWELLVIPLWTAPKWWNSKKFLMNWLPLHWRWSWTNCGWLNLSSPHCTKNWTFSLKKHNLSNLCDKKLVNKISASKHYGRPIEKSSVQKDSLWLWNSVMDCNV